MGEAPTPVEFTRERFAQCSDAGVQALAAALDGGCVAIKEILLDTVMESMRECTAYTQGLLFSYWQRKIGGMPHMRSGFAVPQWQDPATGEQLYPGDPRLHEGQIWYARVVAAHASNDPNLVMDLWMTVPEGEEVRYMFYLAHMAACDLTGGQHDALCRATRAGR